MSSKPANWVLQSVNIFDLHAHFQLSIAALSDHRARQPPVNSVTNPRGHGSAVCRLSQGRSATDSSQRLAESIGVSGHYGLYSASMHASRELDRSEHYTSFHSSFTVTVDYGTAKVRDGQDTWSYLNTNIRRALEGVSNFSGAERFVQEYGTHVVEGVQLGGQMCIKISKDTEDVAESEKLEVSVKASYGALDSVEGAVSAYHSVHRSSEYLTQVMYNIGGQPISPSSAHDWIRSVSADTVAGFTGLKPYWELGVADVALRNPLAVLEDYVKSRMLKESLTNLRVITNAVPLSAQTVTASLPSGLDGYKIVSGGAKADWSKGYFLTGTYPEGDRNRITGWTAAAHKLGASGSEAGHHLTAYALAVYDPFDRLEVRVAQQSNEWVPENEGPHAGLGNAEAPSGFTPVGGGGRANSNTSSVQYLVYCHPWSSDGRRIAGWFTKTHDRSYGTSSGATTAYLTCIRDKTGKLTLESDIATREQDERQSHGKLTATGLHGNVSGGGFERRDNDHASNNLNLLQGSFPNKPGSWQELNKDLNTAYAIQARVHAISLKAALTG